MKIRSITIWSTVLLLVITSNTRANFYLYDNQHLTVNTHHDSGWLFDSSQVDIVSGGYVNSVIAYGTSTTNIYSGNVISLWAYNSSTANVYGGNVNDVLATNDSSTVNISGGNVISLCTSNSGTANISGGHMSFLAAADFSTVIFNGKNFDYGSGLTLDGNRVLGSGILSGEWLNGTPWSVYITRHEYSATILVPEPATIFFLGLGAVILRKRKK